jgi:Protein of unknown function (DUF4197)
MRTIAGLSCPWEISMSRMGRVALVAIWLSAVCSAQSPLDELWKRATGQSASNLSNDRIAAGLKEALRVGTTKAVAITGRPDGFLKNEAIKILLPEKLQTAGRALRLVGMGAQLDELEVGMNRAAEQASPQAKQIFLNAVTSMSINDARGILTGNDTAATDYFRRATSEDLTAAFAPIVHRSMQNVGVVREYQQLMQNSMAGALLRNQKFNLDDYVVGKTLDGLFYMLGEQEKQIRQNPAARTTDLLKQVFGSRVGTR